MIASDVSGFTPLQPGPAPALRLLRPLRLRRAQAYRPALQRRRRRPSVRRLDKKIMAYQSEPTSLLVEQARALKREARAHKRQLNHHRQEAKRCMQRFAELQERLRALGIAVTLDEGDNSHGRNQESSH
jgi:hypothetical protein